MRIDPDWHRQVPINTDEDEQERRDNQLFEDIIAAAIILLGTLAVVAPLFVGYWLTR
jgi:hypothetical protein